VYKEKKEIWIEPIYEFQIQLMLDKKNQNNFASGKIKSISEINKKNVQDVQKLYPDYKVFSYRLNVYEAVFKFLDMPEVKLSQMPTASGWELNLYMQKFPYKNLAEFENVLNRPETFHFEGSILREGKLVRFSPQIVYSITTLEF